MSKLSEEIIHIYLEYFYENEIITREDDVELFILRYRFPYQWHTNTESEYKSRPITILLPIGLKNSEYLPSRFLDSCLHPAWKSKGGRGLVYE